MTPDQELRFEAMVAQTKKIYDFWYEPYIIGQPPRAEQLDRILSLSRGTTFAGKALMMLFGVVVTIATTWAALKGLTGMD